MAFTLQLLGSFRLVSPDGSLVPLSDRARSLLAYLAMMSSPVSRQVMAELLCDEGTEGDQRTVLRQAIYLVRKAIADTAAIRTDQGNVALNEALVSADVRVFKNAMARGDDRSLAEALDLYRGPFLYGERSLSPAFEEWVAACRRDFVEDAVAALLRLAGAAATAGDHGKALAQARRALTLDPLREDVHRQIMRSLAASGQRANALRHFETTRQMLAEELGLAPESETAALREAIASGGPSDDSNPLPAPRDVAGETPAVRASAADTRRLFSLGAAHWFVSAGDLPRAVRQLALPLTIATFMVVIVGTALSRWTPGVWQLDRAPAKESAATASAPLLSVVVLPFTNLSGDPDQDYFVDGITDDLTSDLSRIDGSFVISRFTAFTFKGKYVDVREVGRELGVRYVLEGSVRRAGDDVFVNVGLTDTTAAEQVWTERVAGSARDLAALHNEVTGRLVAALRLELAVAEGRRLERDQPPGSEATDDALRGWAMLYSFYSRENRAEARAIFERALARDPNNVSALVGLAQALEGYTNSPIEDRQRVDRLLRHALDLDPNRAATHFTLGMLRRKQGRLQEAVEAFQKAISLDRNYARAYLYLGNTLMILGNPEEAIVLAQKALRLNPRDPNIADHYWILGSALVLLGRTDEAIVYLEKACAANPRLWYMHMYLAAAYGMANRVEEAKREVAEQLRLRPEFRSLATIRAAIPLFGSPTHVAMEERTLFVGLRRAGLPEVDSVSEP